MTAEKKADWIQALQTFNLGERRYKFATIRRRCFPLKAENGENIFFIQASFLQNLGGEKII
jgi:hypothetical protein